MSTATEMRDAYIAAELAVLKGQSFTIGGRTLTRSNLAEIRTGRQEWEQKCRDEVTAAAGRRGPLRYSTADFTGRG
jgi:hypothetical protein